MNTILDELIEKTYQALKTEMDADKLIPLIRDLMVEAHTQEFEQWSDSRIAEVLVNMTTLLYGLSPKIETARMAYNQAYGYRKFKGAKRYLEIKEGTVAEKESTVEKFITDERQAEVYYSYLSETLRRLHDDCSRLVSVLQSVIRIKEREHFTANITT